MIECRTRGIPMREGTRVDADGMHCFALDESKHDPFDVLVRLMSKLGYVPPERDTKLDDVLRKRMLANEAEARTKARSK